MTELYIICCRMVQDQRISTPRPRTDHCRTRPLGIASAKERGSCLAVAIRGHESGSDPELTIYLKSKTWTPTPPLGGGHRGTSSSPKRRSSRDSSLNRPKHAKDQIVLADRDEMNIELVVDFLRPRYDFGKFVAISIGVSESKSFRTFPRCRCL